MNDRAVNLGMLAGGVGGAIAIAAMELASATAAFPLMLIPFATSIVLVMGMPEAGPAQPRALVGLLTVKLVGPQPWAAALAVGLAMIAMQLTRTFHPPAGIDPLVVVSHDLSWTFFVAPVAAGALLLAVFAFLWHNLMRRGSWPARWW